MSFTVWVKKNKRAAYIILMGRHLHSKAGNLEEKNTGGIHCSFSFCHSSLASFKVALQPVVDAEWKAHVSHDFWVSQYKRVPKTLGMYHCQGMSSNIKYKEFQWVHIKLPTQRDISKHNANRGSISTCTLGLSSWNSPFWDAKLLN